MNQLTWLTELVVLILSILAIIISIASFWFARRKISDLTIEYEKIESLIHDVSVLQERVISKEKIRQNFSELQTLDSEPLPRVKEPFREPLREKNYINKPVVVQENVELKAPRSIRVIRILLTILPFIGLFIGYILYFLLTS